MYGFSMNTNNGSLRLPLTLLPRSCWGQNVRKALPDRWDEIRHEAYRRAGYRCEVDGSDGGGRPLHAHEYFDYRDGRQVLTQIACLSDTAHSATHLGRTLKFSGSDRAAKEALAYLAHVNGWSVQQAAVYAQQELAICAERSTRKWTLDLSLLEREFGIKLPPTVTVTRAGHGWLGRLLGVGR